MKLTQLISSDLKFYGGTSFSKKVVTFLFKHSFSLMFNYRLGHYFLKSKMPLSNFLVIYLKHRQLKYGSCHISYEAHIGKHLNLPHPVGIVIGKGVTIKDGVTLYQNCTVGQNKNDAYPVLYEECIIYPGSVVVGPISIGRGAIVGANSFVNRSIADHTVFHQ